MSNGIARAALVIALGNVASRILGLVREQVIAGLFGASASTDAFRAAGRVPTALYDLLVGGMVSAALIPVFSEYASSPSFRKDSQKELRALVSAVLNLLFLLNLLVVVLLILGAPFFMRFFAYGYYEAGGETWSLSVKLAQLMMPALIFMGISGVLSALLYSRQSFNLPALAMTLYNLGIVVMALLLHRYLGITSLVIGVLVGAFSQMALGTLGLRGIGYTPRTSLRHPGVARILRLYTPVALGLVVSALGIAIDTNLASRTGEGSLAAMGFATTLVQFPLGLVATAVGFAILPTLSRYSQEKVIEGSPTGGPLPSPLASETALGTQPQASLSLFPAQDSAPKDESLLAYKSTLALGIKTVIMTILPATVGLVVLRRPVIRLLFQRGAFDVTATERTAAAFLAYSPGLPAAAVDQLLIFAFYARKKTLVPVLVGLMGVGMYLIAGVSLLGPMGMPGLALANSIQWMSHALVMLFLLWGEVRGLGGLGLGRTAAKVLAASGVMGGVLIGAEPVLSRWLDLSGTMGLGAYLILAMVLGAIVYGGVMALIGREELKALWALTRRASP